MRKITGYILLLDDNDMVISNKKYFCRHGRSSIIYNWIRKYAHNFFNCSIHISPNTPEDKTAVVTERVINAGDDPAPKT